MGLFQNRVQWVSAFMVSSCRISSCRCVQTRCSETTALSATRPPASQDPSSPSTSCQSFDYSSFYSNLDVLFLFCISGFSTVDETSSQISNISKPSAKSIYCKWTPLLWKGDFTDLFIKKNQLPALLCGFAVQRLQYAASMNKMLERFQYKVEVLQLHDASVETR